MVLFLLTGAGCFALCQFLRHRALEAPMPVELKNGTVRLQRTVNKAGAGGMLGKHPALVTGFAAAALVFTLGAALWGSREKNLSRGALWGLGLVAGGGASNLYERLRHGGVLDYIRFPKLPKKLGRLVFNPADFGIFAGALAVLWKELTR